MKIRNKSEKIRKVTSVISLILEIAYWAAAAMMVVLFICSFAASGLLQDIFNEGNISLSTSGAELMAFDSNGNLTMTAIRIFSIDGLIALSLLAMIFRNVNLIVKKSKNSTPFQKDNIRMLKEIGIFSISIPIIDLIMSIILRLVSDIDMVETSINFNGFIMGILVLCLTQFFAHGAELEKEVDGLV